MRVVPSLIDLGLVERAPNNLPMFFQAHSKGELLFLSEIVKLRTPVFSNRRFGELFPNLFGDERGHWACGSLTANRGVEAFGLKSGQDVVQQMLTAAAGS